MVLNPQTSNFPPISQMERSWEQNIRAALGYLVPGSGARSGLKLGLPVDGGGLVTTGLTPTLTDGYLIQADQVLGPYGSKLIGVAEANVSNRNIFFGLSGMYYADATNEPLKPTDVLVGVVTTDNEDPASILHVAQPVNYGAGRWAIRGMVNLAKITDGADQTAFDLTFPDVGLDNIRVTYAQCRVAEPCTAGNDAGDDFVLKVKADAANAVDLVTLDDAVLDDVGTIGRFAAADGDVVSWYSPTSLQVQYNQTDGTTAIAGGAIEFIVEMQLF